MFVYPAVAVPAGAILHDPNALLGHLPWKAGALAPGATVVASVFDAEIGRTSKLVAPPSVAASKVLFGVVDAPGLTSWTPRGTGRELGHQLHLATYRQPEYAGLGLTRVTVLRRLLRRHAR